MMSKNNAASIQPRPSSPAVRMPGSLSVVGARVNNLKNIDVDIPHGTLAVITGLSGSGKSSLAFDTIFAEGQRRYIETFSSYARNMLGNMERPDVDKISGLSPVIAIEQKTVNRNPRSTIGTTTEVYDYLRLLFARAGEARSYLSGEPMVKYSPEKIVELILQEYDNRKIYLLAPLVHNRKGHYKELFENLMKKGYLTVRVDGEIMELFPGMRLDRYRNHSVELVIDKLKVSAKDDRRLLDSVMKTLKQGDKQMMVYDLESEKARHYSQSLMDPVSGLSYREPAPHNFSFNSPLGACRCCKGLGTVNIIDRDKVIPDDSVSIHAGGIAPLGKYQNTTIFWQVQAICEKYGATLKTPIRDLPPEALEDILNGTDERLNVHSEGSSIANYFLSYDGLLKYIEMQQGEDATSAAQRWSGQFFSRKTCPECGGDRLNREALHFFIDGKNIADLSRLDISELLEWSRTVEERLAPRQRVIASEIIKEIRSRLSFLVDVGLGYLSLNRASATLSGGESQRIRLATQLGSELVNVLYILDEPSIGLHQRDNHKLIGSLKRLRDARNSIIVVEHDKDMMLEADYIVDIGPKAGRKGGKVVFEGTPEEMLKTDTLTAGYLNGNREIAVPESRRKGNGLSLSLKGCTGHNLKDVDFTLPLGTLSCVCGVSGSGKSSLVNGTLQPILSQKFYRSSQEPLPYREIVLVPCEACGGRRYNRETLEVRFKGKSIADVLDMTINQAVEFFEFQPSILKKIKVLQDVGLGYIKLGQPSSTLSGGENQRVKLATELAKRDTGKTLFILDEPTTGLHFEDINTLLAVLNRLVDRGNTVLVIEHNLDVVKAADYVIDMGPDGGRNGGMIIATGTPEEVAATDSPTAPYIRQELNLR